MAAEIGRPFIDGLYLLAHLMAVGVNITEKMWKDAALTALPPPAA